MSERQTTDPNRDTWTREEVGMILSARDQIGSDRGCRFLCDTNFTWPCPCLDAAIWRVVSDMEEGDER